MPHGLRSSRSRAARTAFLRTITLLNVSSDQDENHSLRSLPNDAKVLLDTINETIVGRC